MTKKSVLAVLFSVIGSVFTAIAILIIMGIIAVVLIINHLKPEEPPVKHAQFQYRIEYEVYGERYEKSDVFECYYDGTMQAGGGLRRKWERRWCNGDEYNIVKLADINDDYYIALNFPSAEYFMGDPYIYDDDADISKPKIEICFTDGDNFTRNSYHLLEECGFNVISWYCDPPIVQVLED